MRNYIVYFLLGFFGLLSFPSLAQQLNFVKPGSSLALPSEECYNVLQDSKGYIWICTENGLCRYNGSNVKVYNKENGLPEGAIYFIREDKQGVIHMLTCKNRALYVKNDSLVEEKFSNPYLHFLSAMNIRLCQSYSLTVDSHNDYLISTQVKTFKVDHTDFSVSNASEKDAAAKGINFTIHAEGDEPYLVKNKELSPADCDKKDFNVLIDFISAKGRKTLSVPFKRYSYPDWRLKVVKSASGTIFFCFDNKVIKVEPDLSYSVYDMPATIFSLYCDGGNGLWVGIYQNGLRYYDDIKTMKKYTPALEAYSVTGIVIDKEGATWCTTLEKGIFYCNNRYVRDYSNLKGFKKVCTLLKCIGDDVFLASETDNLIILKNDTIIRKKLFDKNTDLTDVVHFNNSWYFSSKSCLIRTQDFQQNTFIRRKRNGGNNCTYQLKVQDDTIYVIGPSLISRVDGDSLQGIYEYGNIKSRCLLVSGNIVFFGCDDGLYLYDRVKGAAHKHGMINTAVTKMIENTNGEIWIATKAGLYILHNNTLKKIDFKHQVQSDIFLDLTQDKYNNIWVASNVELLKITKDRKGVMEVITFNATNGLISDNIKCIAVNDRHVYISTANGLCTVPVDKVFRNTVAPPVFINRIIAGGKEINPGPDQLIFAHNENTFDIYFDALTYKKNDRGILLYRLSGQDDSMKVSMQSTLHFENLPPDKYTLTVYALNNEGIRSITPVVLGFVIEKPFWQTFWFISICVIAFFTVLFFAVKAIIQNIKRREEEKTRINKLISESQLSALQAQMNPHFIFNAINSIQNYILRKEEKEAYDYLAKFSKLIRIVLNNSRESTLPLYRELETLNLYIELEKLRFKDSFEFQLTVSGDVNEQEISLPAMLIQPYVENAIWHGLMNIEDDRVRILKLDFSIGSGLLKVVIEDNGIGRERSYRYKTESIHKPVAMKLTEQRLGMISRIKDYEGIRITIIDLYDNEGNPAGTKVELFLPVLI